MMNITYMPILKPKEAEFIAYNHLTENEKKSIYPFFDITKPSLKEMEKTGYSLKNYLDKKSDDIINCFDQTIPLFKTNPIKIVLDTFYFAPDTTLDNNVHIMSYLFNKFRNRNVDILPVVGYERWDDSTVEYKQALMNISKQSNQEFCIRLGIEALDQDMIYEPEYFHERFDQLLDDLMIIPYSCIVLLDFENLKNKNISDTVQQVKYAIQMLRKYKFSKIFIAGNSIPNSIGEIVEKNSTTILQRKEILIWKHLINDPKYIDIGFSDYAVRNSNSQDNTSGRNINAKIWYTIEDAYFVARGHQLKEFPYGDQFKELAISIIKSNYLSYYSSNWADKMIFQSIFRTIRDNKKWICISTNRHIHFTLKEISEHKNHIFAKNLIKTT